ncbi:MAG: PQQ-binding-like beta-propeller repeat protein [Planctomycetota bacterium]
MSDAKPNETQSTNGSTAAYRQLRIWIPALIIIVTLIMMALPMLVADASEALMMVSVMGPVVSCLLALIWWVAFSRARWTERLVGLLGIFAIFGVVSLVSDPSMVKAVPMMKLTIPVGIGMFTLGAILCSKILSFKRTIIALVMLGIGVSYSGLLRHEGMSSDTTMALKWRWTPTAEQLLVNAKNTEPPIVVETDSPEMDAAIAKPEWSEFRGANRDGRYLGPPISTDWSSDPEQVWKVPVGPGWSSFSIAGELLYTQEQRGDLEAVVCYEASSGKEIWTHEIKARFEESIGGPGPRATPTIAQGSLFAHGAKGDVVRLDPKTGAEVWRQNVGTLANRNTPSWGYSSSPLVIGSNVIVHVGGAGDKGTIALDIENGEVNWTTAAGDHSYISPHLATILGKQYVLMLTNVGLNVLEPESGVDVLNYEWKTSGYRSLQPLVINGDSIILSTGMGTGTRRIKLSSTDEGLTATETWSNPRFAPDFNDMVLFEGHLYGFTGMIFTCIDAETGEQKWKGGRYGKGQVLLVEQSGALIVLSEKGEVVLLKADPSSHQELAKFKAINGKTWAHPVLVGDRLFVRNAEEAACYRLPLDDESKTSSKDDVN